MTAAASAVPKVALVCTGLGRVTRGYEASVRELYLALRDTGAVRLYGGGAGVEGAEVLPNIPRLSPLYRAVPLWLVNSSRRYGIECFTAGLSLFVKLTRSPVQVIFTPDHRLADLMLRLRDYLPGRPRVIFSNGAPFDSGYVRKFDSVHQKSYCDYRSGIARFGSEITSYLIPNGFDAERLRRPSDFEPASVRVRYGIPTDRAMILALSALQLTHKRLDWIMSEFAKLAPGSAHLVMAGAQTDETTVLRNHAASTLAPGSFTILSAPYHDVPALIWSADMMTLGSLSEGFPRVVAEAMGARCYIAVHPHENNIWILDNPDCYVDMTQRGALTRKMSEVIADPNRFAAVSAKNLHRFSRDFSWQAVAPQYMAMFQDATNEKEGGA